MVEITSFIPFAKVYYEQLLLLLGLPNLSLIAYTFGMVFYTIFIWHLYRFISRRDVFPLELQKHMSGGRKFLNVIAYMLEYLVIFPALVFMWFGAFSFFMLFLAKELTTHSILLISMSLIATIRITSYYNEDISKDVGKLIPFGLLAIFLVSPSFFSTSLMVSRFAEALTFGKDILGFAAFVILVEWILRIMHLIKRVFIKDVFNIDTLIRKGK